MSLNTEQPRWRLERISGNSLDISELCSEGTQITEYGLDPEMSITEAWNQLLIYVILPAHSQLF
jgi:hypothetical protein